MGKNEQKLENKEVPALFFYGNTKKLKKNEKKLHRRHSLLRVIAINTVIILLLIFCIWILGTISI